MLAVPALGGPDRPRHLRTLMSPLIDFFPETQNTGEVNDPSPGGASCCHFLLGLIFHHFHIGAFPMSLPALKVRNLQIMTILFKLKKKKNQPNLVSSLLEKGAASLCWLCTSGEGSWGQASKISLSTLRSQQLALYTAGLWTLARPCRAAGR